MSTRTKEGVSNVRENRGTSPSPSYLKSSPKPSKTFSTSRSLGSSPSLEKATPNYLKPTLSSSLSSWGATKLQGRMPMSNTDSALKSNLARRRSFDKPPSPTRTMKTRGVSPTPTFRSSFSGKTGAARALTSPKSDRSLKGTTEAGKQHLYARAVGTLKKSATFASKSKKTETATASSRKKDSSDHQESNIAGDEEDSVVADQELVSSNEQTQGEIDEDTLEDVSHKADSPTAPKQLDADGDDAAEVESSPTILEQRDASIGEAESPTICEESDDNVPKIESPTLLGEDDADIVNDVDGTKAESPVSSEQRVESPAVSEQAEGNSSQQQEVEEHNTNEMVSTINPDHSNPNEDKDRDEGEEAKALDMKHGGEAGEVQQGVVEDDGEAAPRLSYGKTDVALSNNVIEEMTREQRRNKVRALAGAFETVISLQEHK